MSVLLLQSGDKLLLQNGNGLGLDGLTDIVGSAAVTISSTGTATFIDHTVPADPYVPPFEPTINIRFNVEANALVGAVGLMAVSWIGLSGAGQGGSQGKFSAPLLVSSSAVSVGAVGRLDVPINRMFNLHGSGTPDVAGRAVMVAPLFRSLFGVHRGTAPLFALRGIASGGLLVPELYNAMAVNIKNAALTEYTGFAFNHMVIFNGQTVAFSDAGAFLLGGDLDVAAEINSVAELAPTDFGSSNMKRMPYMYIGTKTGAAMLVSTIADEDEILASLTATVGRNRRAKMARGKKARYWAAKIQNRNGEDFAIDSIEYLPMALGRKV
jgi:hypothetical protein